MSELNWARNLRYRAEGIHRPSSLEELQELVARVLGSRHSFNAITDAAELVSLPHITVAGAIATATHGSGDAGGNLATAVAGLELVTSSGEIVRAARGEPDFDGLVVGLGALGAVTRITLDVEPAYELRQRVFEGLEWDALRDHFDAITAAGQSVSILTHWGEQVDAVWVKSREDVVELFGARPATVERHLILGLDPANTTPQLGVPGLWSDRLPHFRMGFTPSHGDEVQSEYLVGREHALAPFDARPHWGKLFLAPAGGHYERRPDFARLIERYDPRGGFRNAWLEDRVLG